MFNKLKQRVIELKKLIFSKGFKFRWGVRIKDFGERISHANILGWFFLGWLADPIIAWGLRIKEAVLSTPIGER